MTQQTVKGCFVLSIAFLALTNVASKWKCFIAIIGEGAFLKKTRVSWIMTEYGGFKSFIKKTADIKSYHQRIHNSFVPNSPQQVTTVHFYYLNIPMYHCVSMSLYNRAFYVLSWGCLIEQLSSKGNHYPWCVDNKAIRDTSRQVAFLYKNQIHRISFRIVP